MKPKRIALLIMILLFVIFGLWSLTVPAKPAAADEPQSAPGKYSGYSPALYEGYTLSSQYIPVRDGTKIALDIFRPTLNGAVVETKLPVVWMHTAYNRRYFQTDLTAKLYPGAALGLVKYGYVVAVADQRGNYASFGKAVSTNRNQWMPYSYWDAYDITEWLAAQPWSDGNIGMWGCSAPGHTQWQAAVTKPPHLKAIFPMSAPGDYYDIGGMFLIKDPPPSLPVYPGSIPANDQYAVAVDEDTDNTLLNAAKEEHRWNLEPGYLPYRDSVSGWLETLMGISHFQYWLEVNTFTHLSDIQMAGIPIYSTANWGEDYRVKRGALVKYQNLTTPAKMLYGPGGHCIWCTEYSPKAYPLDFNIVTEELRWFDYWLKGIQNGIMDEPPIYYFTYNASSTDQDWKFAWQWPLPGENRLNYYLGPGPSDGASSGVNNGILSPSTPTTAGAKDEYPVDYTVTTATRTQKGLTYTTAPLTSDTNVTGDPVVHLWVSSTATDGDFLAFIEDVAEDGSSTTIPGSDDGRLRASHRALATAPYNTTGLPYHRSYAEDIKALTSGEPVELIFDLAPLSYIFKTGHRIRLTVTCFMPASGSTPSPTPVLSPAPVVTFYRNPQYSSYISLPVVAPVAATARIVPGETTLAAHMTFPETMDSRYLSDIKMSSVKCNGIGAASTRMEGNTLIAVFSRSNLKEGQAMAVSGEFGNKYNYGNMTFAASGTVPTSSGSSNVCFIDTAGSGTILVKIVGKVLQTIIDFFAFR